MGLIAMLVRTYYKIGLSRTHASLSGVLCPSPPACLAGTIVSPNRENKGEQSAQAPVAIRPSEAKRGVKNALQTAQGLQQQTVRRCDVVGSEALCSAHVTGAQS